MDIGDIAVTRKGCKNPYLRSEEIVGPERSEQLGRFLKGKPTPEHEFWYAPACGGAYKLNSPGEAEVGQETIDYYWGEE